MTAFFQTQVSHGPVSEIDFENYVKNHRRLDFSTPVVF